MAEICIIALQDGETYMNPDVPESSFNRFGEGTSFATIEAHCRVAENPGRVVYNQEGKPEMSEDTYNGVANGEDWHIDDGEIILD